MLINLGRLLMLFVWAFLILNLVHPFPRPLNIFVNVALVFMALMHGMQLALLKSTIPKEGPQMTTGEKIRIFLFGVFELLVWRRSLRTKNNVCCRMTVHSLSGVRLTNPTNRVPL
ncbi:DUF1145 family protein [Salmonella enterica]